MDEFLFLSYLWEAPYQPDQSPVEVERVRISDTYFEADCSARPKGSARTEIQLTPMEIENYGRLMLRALGGKTTR